MTPVRVAAARALLAIEKREGTLAAVLETHRDAAADDRDIALLTTLVTGVLRWRNEVDAVIASAGRRSARTFDAPVLAVLRLGVYQLRHLDRVPDHAVVNESVAAVRALGVSSAAGLVNAVLRAVIRRGPAISLPSRPADASNADAQVNYLATALSHPAWLVRRWLARYGFEATEAWCRFNNSVPATTIRAIDGTPVAEVAALLEKEGIETVAAPHVTDALRLVGGLGRVPFALRARLWIQDEGAQLVARFANVQAGERVLDLCASPGGKTLVMADALGRPDAGLGLVAADHRARRIALLRDTLTRARLDVPVVRLDATAPLPFSPVFDCVVVDAPCTGLGTLRRDPDLKWARTADEPSTFAAAQVQMLRSAAEVVRPGGRLIYATCSSEPEENDAVVSTFLQVDSRFHAADPAPVTGVAADLIDRNGHLATRPDRDGLEAFFAAALVRREGT
jgi:16S rRNA (cytosine967-C5)-methyltransferase